MANASLGAISSELDPLIFPPIKTELYCAPRFKSKAKPVSSPPNTHCYPATAPPPKEETVPLESTSFPVLLL